MYSIGIARSGQQAGAAKNPSRAPIFGIALRCRTIRFGGLYPQSGLSHEGGKFNDPVHIQSTLREMPDFRESGIGKFGQRLWAVADPGGPRIEIVEPNRSGFFQQWRT